MKTKFTVSTVLPATPEAVYRAWLSSAGHSAMTGSPAQVDGRVGGAFFAWDHYITGMNLQLKPYRYIVQAWRTTDFPEEAPDSQLDIALEETSGGTKLTLMHSNIPEGQADDYQQGWDESYFQPMKAYFAAQAREAEANRRPRRKY
jgi:activator of HSP90 ATPase